MSKRYPWAKWTLPTTIDPPRTCYTIPVPDDPYHKAAFRGALLALASATKWQDDPAHTALAAAAVWQEIYDLVVECETETLGTGDLGDMTTVCEALRFQNGKLQGLCCGVWSDISGQPPQGWNPGATGTQITPPAAGGSCQDYNAAMSGNGYWYAPFVVNSGDTIVISEAVGATYNPANGGWYCTDGSLFFGGACLASALTAGGNPMPAILSGKLIAKIGSTFYDVYNGTFTVPGGITSQPVQFQINYASIATSSGDISFKVHFCNNVAATWSHTFDFTLSPQGFSQFVNAGPPAWGVGVWTAGVGWVNSDGYNTSANQSFRGIDIIRSGLSSFELMSMSMLVNMTKGAFVGGGISYGYGLISAPFGVYQQVLDGALVNGSSILVGPAYADHTAQTGLQLINICGNKLGTIPGLTGACTIISCTITGKGTQPTW